jgi:hypothetical protein
MASRELRMARIAAMKKVLSPSSVTMISVKDALSADHTLESAAGEACIGMSAIPPRVRRAALAWEAGGR